MTDIPQVAFVTAPSTVPQTLVDLNASDDAYVDADSFDLGTPTFEAAPASVGGKYGWRMVKFTVVLRGNHRMIAPIQQQIAQQLLAPTGWLMVQSSPSESPMFARYYRTPQEPVSWSQSDFDLWTLPVQLECDPWFTGSLETVLAAAVVSHNPANANGLYVDAPAVRGDFETPAILWTPNAANFNDRWVATEPDPPAGVYFVQAEAGTMGTDTATVANDATFSGAGSNSVETSFATVATLANRITNMALPASIPTGDYRVFGVVRSSNSTSTYRIVLHDDAAGADVVGGEVLWAPSGSARATVDFGVSRFPVRSGPASIGYLTGVGTNAPVLSMAASRETGTGLLRSDYFVLIPASHQSLYVTGLTSVTATAVVDAVNMSAYYVSTASPFDAAATILTPPSTLPAGGWPMLQPGVKTRLHFPPKAAPAVSSSFTVSVAYYPRYLHARPDGG